MTEFYRFQCESSGDPTEAELLIFAPIGDWEDFGEVSAKGFASDLKALPKSVKRLDIHINSPGGSLTEAQAIYSRLADHKSDKHVYIDGIAASAASIIAMVGHKVYIRANANLMIHLPSGISIGNADDMRTMAGALDSLTEGMINVYAKRTKMERNDLRDLLAAETWMDADTAVEKGFADEVRGVVKAAASLGEHQYTFNGAVFDLSRYHNIPAFRAKHKGVTMAKPKATATATEDDEPTPTPTPTPEPAPPKPAPAPKPAAQKKTDDDEEDDDEKENRARASGVQQERARIAALQKLDRPATHDIIVKAIEDGKEVSDIIGEVMAAMDKTNTQAARRMDASVLNGIPASDGGTTGDGEDFGARITASVQKKLKQRRVPVTLNSRN